MQRLCIPQFRGVTKSFVVAGGTLKQGPLHGGADPVGCGVVGLCTRRFAGVAGEEPMERSRRPAGSRTSDDGSEMGPERTRMDEPNTPSVEVPRPGDASGKVLGVVGVIQRGDAFLMIQRAEGILASGAWCFPGGAVHDGESTRAALIRETREEVGLDVRPGQCVWRWQRADGRLELEFWTADIVGGQLRPDPAEVQRVEWMTVAEIRRLDHVLPNLFTFLDRYRAD